MGSFDQMVQDMDDPSVEVEGQMAEGIAEDVVEDTAPEAEPQPEPEPKPEPTPAETDDEPSSFLLGDEEDGDTPPPAARKAVATRVPISTLQKERHRRQEAERRLAEIEAAQEQATQQPEPVIDFSADLSGILESDDDYVDKKTAVEMLNRTGRRVAEETRKSVLRTIQEQRQAETVQAESRSQKAFIVQSENAARKTFSNFDAVVSTALKTGTLTVDDLDACRNAPNPGAALYLKSKRVLTDLEIAAPQGVAQAASTPQTTVPKQEQEQTRDDGEDMDDESFYQKILGHASD